MDEPRPAESGSPPAGELRFAVAMRGGVSLAVWMGGACQEIAELRASAGAQAGAQGAQGTQDARSPYAELLKVAGYDKVTVDVLAGTSAGGLNGVLLACHLVYGMKFGANIRKLWLQVGDLESLTRHPRTRVPDSLLRGDEVFYDRLAGSLLGELSRQPRPEHPGGPVRLILPTTRITPRQDWVRPTLGPPMEVGRARAFFRFRHRPGTALTDFGMPGAWWPPEDEVRRLAYAARTSSSFPGAFEPAQPFVGPGTATPGIVDMSGVSSEVDCGDASDGRLELIDGGLLDNIPVAWAIRAVAGAPASAPVDRWLLYLQPVPPAARDTESPPSERRMTRLLKVALKTSAIKTGAESLWDDAVELRVSQTAAALRQAPAAALPEDDWRLTAATPDRIARYRELAGTAEADRFARLLEDPAEVTGPDPLPLPPGPSPLGGDGSPAVLTALRAGSHELALPDGVISLTDLRVRGHSPLPLARAVRLLFDWIRAAEDAGMTVSPDDRMALYDCRLAIAVLVAARDRLVLRRFADTDGTGVTDPVDRIREATDRLQQLMTGTPAPEPGAGEAWRTWPDELVAAMSAASDAAAVGTDWPSDPYLPLWRRLAHLGQLVGVGLTEPVPGFETLHNAARTGPNAFVKALLAAEVLIGPLRPDPLGEPTPIRFHTISAANASWASDLAFPDPAQGLVDAKLGGNQLSNFASFLSSRWRLNDWTWGRLDTAVSLVNVVATDDRLKARYGTPDAAALEETLGESAGPSGTGNPWDPVRALLTRRIQQHILAEELPLVDGLQLAGHDGPPSDQKIDEYAQQPLPEPAAIDVQDLGPLRDIGAEPIAALLPRPDPRRAALRLGLVAWQALQPSGDGGGARAVRGLMKVARPLLCS